MATEAKKKGVVLTDTAHFVLRQNDRGEVLEHLSAIKGEVVELVEDIFTSRVKAGVLAPQGSKAARKAQGEVVSDDEPDDVSLVAASDAASGVVVTPENGLPV